MFGSEAERADSAAALESAQGIIRAEAGRQTAVRFTPLLSFKHDPPPDSAPQLDDLIHAPRARDAAAAPRAAGPPPALPLAPPALAGARLRAPPRAGGGAAQRLHRRRARRDRRGQRSVGLPGHRQIALFVQRPIARLVLHPQTSSFPCSIRPGLQVGRLQVASWLLSDET
ncbi:ribosome-binding factor A, partial [Staphylococcus haemolyticus]|uniref:ribosome-binding factor A n=1 Tax=Staphylococcus haemolyticus TaxID=1283 RepID=UPI0034E23096